MLQAFEGFWDIVWHIYTDMAIFIVPFNCQTETIITITIIRHCVVFYDCIENIIFIVPGKYFTPKSLTHKQKLVDNVQFLHRPVMQGMG